MRLSPIVLRIRSATTNFENRVAGAAEIADVFQNTHKANTAFVIQISEECEKNTYSPSINQTISEQFAIVVALANDSSQRDKTGLTAYDSLYTIRSQLFSAVLGWLMDGAESVVCYRGGRLLGFDRSYLWYQFIFEADFRITDNDGISDEDAAYFETIYAQYEMTPSANIPYTGDMPVPAYEFTPDQEQSIDLTTDPDAGGFDIGFDAGFDGQT